MCAVQGSSCKLLTLSWEPAEVDNTEHKYHNRNVEIGLQMARPDDEEVEKTKAETAAALGLVVNSKIAAAQPKTLPQQPGAPTSIKYTPTQQGPQYNSGASQRIIKIEVRTYS